MKEPVKIESLPPVTTAMDAVVIRRARRAKHVNVSVSPVEPIVKKEPSIMIAALPVPRTAKPTPR
jgi:hypothetical protein